ncbi:MFS transporter [Streptomyces sp. NPDC002564]|uniref:MFS transporter n=1 Tax=Streptomyces sp. NPDC002564 TaxID=3364649 RepID=UPI00367DDB28
MRDPGAPDDREEPSRPAAPAAGPARTFWGLLARPDFRMLLIGETTSKLGTSVTSVLLPLVAVSTLDASPFLVGLLTAAPWLPWLLVGLPAGAWVDRLPCRPVMLVCNAVSATLFAAVPVAWWLGVLDIVHLLVVALLTGAASVFFSTAYSTYLPSLVGADELLEGNAKLQVGDQAARVAGPGLGGVVAQAVGSAPGLLLDVLSFLVSSVCLLRIKATERRPAPRRRRLRQEIHDGLRFVAHDPYVRLITVFGAALNLALASYQAVQVVFLVRAVGAEPGLVGVLISFGGLGGVAGGLAARGLARRFGSARALLRIQFVAAPFALLIPLTEPGPRLALFVIGSTVLLAGVVACNVIIVSFRQAYCPAGLIGRVTATTLVLNFSTIPLGAVIGGTVNTFLGSRATMWLVAAALLVVNLPLLGSALRGLRDLPAPAAAHGDGNTSASRSPEARDRRAT